MLLSELVCPMACRNDRLTQLLGFRCVVTFGGSGGSRELLALANHLVAECGDRRLQLFDLVPVIRVGSPLGSDGFLSRSLERVPEHEHLGPHGLQFDLG